MDKISGYVIANAQGGYDVVKKTSQNAIPFVIPNLDEDIPKADKSKDFTFTDYDPFKDMAETGNVNCPGYIHTKTTPTRSDAEILKDIEELAKEHARTGESSNYNEKFNKLMDEYISSVSPDRAGILKKSVQEISSIIGAISQDYKMSSSFQQIDSQRSHKEEEEEKETELIDYLLDGLENKGKDNSAINEGTNGIQNGMLKSDMYEGAIKDGKVQYMDFFDPDIKSEGSERRFSIMGYIGETSGGALVQQLTTAEWTRKQEANAAYNAAYDFSVGRRSEQPKVPNVNGIENPSLLKELYNSAYDKLMSERA